MLKTKENVGVSVQRHVAEQVLPVFIDLRMPHVWNDGMADGGKGKLQL